ncbi:MAG: cyclic nucleotide-binding domain-containing protein [Gemmatimonadaceae bacterium]
MTASRMRPARRVDSHNHVATYQCGDRIFAEGSEGDEFFIVVTGLVGLSKEIDGAQKELHRIGPGESLARTPSSALRHALRPPLHSSLTPASLPWTRPASSISSASIPALPCW